MKLIRNIKLLSLHNFFTDFVFFAPVAIIYFAKVTGSYALGMSIFSVAYTSAAIFEVPTGIISDLVGRKQSLILGSLCSVICVVLYAVGNAYWVIFLGAVFQGLSRAFYSGNNDALLHDTLKDLGKEKEYHSYLGKTASMFQLALAIASITGGLMAFVSFKLVMWASVVPQICALVVSVFIIEPSIVSKEKANIFSHLRESINQFKQNYSLRLLTTASVIRFAIGESAYFFRSAFVNTLWPIWAIGITNMASHISAFITYYHSGKIIDKFGALKILNFEIISNRIINLVALIFPSVISPILMSSTSLTFGVGSVATGSLLQKEFTDKQRATMGSLSSLVGNMVFGASSVLLGFVADAYGPANALIIANLLLLLPLYFYRRVFVHDRKISLLHDHVV